jgi:hypothetical protein
MAYGTPWRETGLGMLKTPISLNGIKGDLILIATAHTNWLLPAEKFIDELEKNRKNR